MRFTKMLFGTLAPLLFSACADIGSSQSSLSGGNGHKDAGVQAGDCTLTQGYWKTHESAWPVSSLKLGTVTYAKAELLAILRTPVRGNGLISLAHQLIAAKLNIAAGADDVEIKATITAADALIGDLVIGVDQISTNQVSNLVADLDAFNNGDIGPGHCGDDNGHGDGSDHDDDEDDGDCDHDDDGHCDEQCPDDDTGEDEEPAPVCGNGTLELGEACDDGNVTAHDGCSAECQIELPVCGNGILEAGEDCDDGNLVNGDGCSAVCICDTPVH